jgi:transposase
MRGEVDPQSSMFHYFSVESRIPADHPLRRVKKLAESALSAISAELDGLYARTGRPSIPPERLLKAQLLIAFYSVRSDRLFCEQLDYNLLFRWFLDLDLESGGLDQSNFSRLRERLVETDIARRFFDEVVRLARKDKLLSSDHFTVDGTLIDAWASFKSFKRKDDDEPPKPGDGTGMVDFKGEKRSNATHQSTTDPDAKLMRKGNGQPAKLSYGGHALMENRSGLCVDLLITDATQAEPVIGYLEDDCGLRRNWLKGSEGDVLHPVLRSAGYKLRWLMLNVSLERQQVQYLTPGGQMRRTGITFPWFSIMGCVVWLWG